MAMEKLLEEKEKGLETKVAEKEMICAENEELKKRVEEQRINARDAERMKREVRALERDIGDIENQRNGWEEKAWDLDSAARNEYKKLEELMLERNQSLRRLKLGNEFQYQLNAQGTSPMELEAQLDLVNKERQDITSSCATEARRMVEEVETETQKLDQAEREAAYFLKIRCIILILIGVSLLSKASKAKLQETTQTEEEVQNDLAETAGAIADKLVCLDLMQAADMTTTRSVIFYGDLHHTRILGDLGKEQLRHLPSDKLTDSSDVYTNQYPVQASHLKLILGLHNLQSIRQALADFFRESKSLQAQEYTVSKLHTMSMQA
ncbi:hypothetical protein HAX54_047370 [Datura stramonium]|uniref:Uncharacterized protein n=1 Tax=Datura stramonium TaxID=4076 RepID=A0ABS8ST38_DATST|nr:hypothetical protein [Datura stramonium]